MSPLNRFGLILLLPAGLADAAVATTMLGTNRYSPYPPVRTGSEGISWSEGQALPAFATPAAQLDAIEVQALSRDEQITFSALQGQVNRTKPRLLLLDARTDEGRDTWLNTATVALEVGKLYTRETKFDLVAKYAGEIRGLVLYDPSLSEHYRNLAGTVAGLRRALPVTAEVQQGLRERALNLEVLEDLTTLPHRSAIQVYQHLYDTYWLHCDKRFILSARPDRRGGDFHHTRDLAAACGSAVVWLDNRIPAERELMSRFFGGMKAGEGVVLGWYSSERSGVGTASEFGLGTLPADHYLNATVHSGIDHRIRIPPVPRMPALSKKAYVAVFISDGDNIQYAQRAMRRIWDQSASVRGRVALNWTIAPGLVDIGPGILNHYYATATPNDCFVTGPSGMGYMMPFNTLEEPGAPVGLCLTDPERMDGYARLTETYLLRSGLRVVTIWDQATPMHRASYAKHVRSLYGATVQNFRDVPSVEGSVEDQRVRFDKLVIPYVGTYEHMHRSLTSELERWKGDSPLFLAYQVSIWNEMKPGRIVDLEEAIQLQFPGQVEFVRADHYFNLYNQAHGLPFNLVLSPNLSVRAGGSTASPEVVADGSPATVWTSSGDGERWVEFDLGQSCQISRYVLRHAGASGLDPAHNTRGFTLHVSGDGESWTTLDECRGNTENVTDVEFKPVAARHVKIIVDDPGTDATARIADVEIFGRCDPAQE